MNYIPTEKIRVTDVTPEKLVSFNKFTIVSRDESMCIVDSFFIGLDDVFYSKKVYINGDIDVKRKRASGISEIMDVIAERKHTYEHVYMYAIRKTETYLCHLCYMDLVSKGGSVVNVLPNKNNARAKTTWRGTFTVYDDLYVKSDLDFMFYDNKTNKWVICDGPYDKKYLEWLKKNNFKNEYLEIDYALSDVLIVEDVLKFVNKFSDCERHIIINSLDAQ